MKHLMIKFILGVLVSFYLFPVEFTFLPSNINTKMILAVIGAIFIGLNLLTTKRLLTPKDIFGASIISIIFSVICFLSANYNNTGDYSYATYFVSFLTWMTGAYGIYNLLKLNHKKVSFKLLTLYLTGVCVAQCVSAMMIDRIPVFKMAVDSVFNLGQDFMEDVGRLYGIGAALDPAGTRFSIVLLMISFVLFNDLQIQRKRSHVIILILSFFTIGVIGNMIARTTSVGFMGGLIYMVYSLPLFKMLIKVRELKLWASLLFLTIFVIVVVAFLYNTDAQTYSLLRFAFEGFFNWVETGVWRTGSTDTLNNVMWIWPDDLKTWIIGSGWFGAFIFSTDIGYCRFILYCGIIGFSAFASLFVYGAYIFSKKFPVYRLFFLGLLALSFIIWMKVSTDLFLIHALFYCIDSSSNTEEYELQNDVGLAAAS
ncbi:MAG: hypothetical protein LBE56_13490 [Tannerella sp.]|jgi:hypothetical protein|nr:hypothetical protein [Tannerella sp.]